MPCLFGSKYDYGFCVHRNFSRRIDLLLWTAHGRLQQHMNFLGFLFLGKKLFQVQLHVSVYRGNLVCRVTEHRSAESKVRRDNAAVFTVSDRRKGIHLKKRITNLVI